MVRVHSSPLPCSFLLSSAKGTNQKIAKIQGNFQDFVGTEHCSIALGVTCRQHKCWQKITRSSDSRKLFLLDRQEPDRHCLCNSRSSYYKEHVQSWIPTTQVGIQLRISENFQNGFLSQNISWNISPTHSNVRKQKIGNDPTNIFRAGCSQQNGWHLETIRSGDILYMNTSRLFMGRGILRCSKDILWSSYQWCSYKNPTLFIPDTNKWVQTHFKSSLECFVCLGAPLIRDA